jgi:hypothetical protein
VKLHVVHDADGNILAAVQEPDEETDDTLIARPFPLSAGHRAAQIEVAQDYLHLQLEEICTRLRVDPGGPRLVLRENQDT